MRQNANTHSKYLGTRTKTLWDEISNVNKINLGLMRVKDDGMRTLLDWEVREGHFWEGDNWGTWPYENLENFASEVTAVDTLTWSYLCTFHNVAEI